jgi:hypothetical protein
MNIHPQVKKRWILWGLGFIALVVLEVLISL